MSIICKECHEKLLGCCLYDDNPNDIQIGITFPEIRRIMKEKDLSYSDIIIKDNIAEQVKNALAIHIHPVFNDIFTANLRFRLKTVSGRCVFLTDKGCSLSNNSKPHYCKIYPFWLINDSNKLQVLVSDKCLAQKHSRDIQGLLKLFNTDRNEIIEIFKQLLEDAKCHKEEIGDYQHKRFIDDFSFRRLSIDDKEMVCKLVKDIWDGDDYLPVIYDKWVFDTSGEFIGAYYEQRLIGLAKLSFYAKGYAWLEGLRADPQAPVRGIATAFNKYLLERIHSYSHIHAIEFNTYFSNFASIHSAEKSGFVRRAIYSYKMLELNDLVIYPILTNFNAITYSYLEIIMEFLHKSEFLQANRLCSGWEAYPVIEEIIEHRFIEKSGSLVVLDNNKIIALLLYEDDDLQKISHLSFIDGEEDSVKGLLNAYFKLSIDKGLQQIDLAMPRNYKYFELIKSLGFESFEQEDDYFLYRYNDYKK